MFNYFLTKIVGTKQERDLKRLTPILEEVNDLGEEIKALSDEELKNKTPYLKEMLKDGESLDDILPEAFAVVREAATRTINMRHFDAQIMGGIVLHQGKIAEMATGEGKTLVATLATYLNALAGKGVHIVTVNDYLAKRDRFWMGPIYEFLGLRVGFIQHDMPSEQRKEVYKSDITYGTNNEFGFDYLRDNMVPSEEFKVQRHHNYAIVDEVDSILIDEARTPLIISGPTEESTDKYYKINRIIPSLRKEKDYQVDEKVKTATLSEEGVASTERLLNVGNLFDPSNIEWVHHINQALKAHTLFKRDVDYMVKEGKVVIVDEFTGRLMPGRRYSEGLHQALEAKEGLKIEQESQTLATITFQNYFRMYEKLAGMTGTADTEAEEFDKIYHLEVVVIPTNKTLIRTNYSDVIYKTEREKFKAVVDEIEELRKVGRPTLVGTISVEKSERLSSMLKKKGIPHHVLNAKYHEKEAEIVAQAGKKGAVTIATNMAGRGTDIVLGGNPPDLQEHEEVVGLEGLHIIGTERHESRRIDNQLRGRAGRQGDPGSSRFYVSLEDDLMRIFGSNRIQGILEKLGMEEGQEIEHPWITKAIERAQTQVEAHNFDIRKHLLEYDDVMNQQREVIYRERDMILEKEDISEHIEEIVKDVAGGFIDTYCAQDSHPEGWDVKSFTSRFKETFGLVLSKESIEKARYEELHDLVLSKAKEAYRLREREVGPERLRQLERMVFLHVVDNLWKDHLYSMDSLKEGIGLRGYGQRDPLVEYKHEAYHMFEDLTLRVKEEVAGLLFKVQFLEGEEPGPVPREHYRWARPESRKPVGVTPTKIKHKIGRNAPCPCGSGKKYKRCCGK